MSRMISLVGDGWLQREGKDGGKRGGVWRRSAKPKRTVGSLRLEQHQQTCCLSVCLSNSLWIGFQVNGMENSCVGWGGYSLAHRE